MSPAVLREAGGAAAAVSILPMEAAHAGGRGVGASLLAALIERAEAGNLWTLQAGIFPENKASLALHQGLGFAVVGTRRRLAKMSFGPLANTWRDVLLLERRSVRVGTD